MISGAQAEQLEAPSRWQSAHYQDHVLVGTLWRGDGNSSTWQELNTAINEARYVLVGEIHPNPDHHRFQAKVLASLITSGQQPTVVWEMIPSASQPVLDEWARASEPDASALGQLLEWSDSGWPEWSLYQPIAQVAAKHRLKMSGAALPRETLMTLGREGADGIEKTMRSSLHLDLALDDQAQAGMMKSLREGHCNLMADEALEPMSIVQRARDGAMANAMLGNNPQATSVLIAGNGHVRKDWGVGNVLAQLSPQHLSLSIAQIEVQEDQTQPAAYFTQIDVASGYDFIVFTPKAEIKDYCAELRKQFGEDE